MLFSGALVFLFSAITATAVTNSLTSGSSQVASVGSFVEGSDVQGAVSEESVDDTDSNIIRLKQKIAAGEGQVSAGGPVFTSVDDSTPEENEDVVTDQTPPKSVQIGVTVDGAVLMSNELWRFVGYSQFEQIGTANNGTPIFGSRSDNFPLDQCGGGNDGSGYKYYLNSGVRDLGECITGV